MRSKIFAVDRNGFRGVDADADLVALDAEDRDRDFLSDHHGFADASGKNQHGQRSFVLVIAFCKTQPGPEIGETLNTQGVGGAC